ncbi:MAG: hypothetical protein WCJ18_03750 [Planctomycetota bacterium]
MGHGVGVSEFNPPNEFVENLVHQEGGPNSSGCPYLTGFVQKFDQTLPLGDGTTYEGNVVWYFSAFPMGGKFSIPI